MCLVPDKKGSVTRAERVGPGLNLRRQFGLSGSFNGSPLKLLSGRCANCEMFSEVGTSVRSELDYDCQFI